MGNADLVFLREARIWANFVTKCTLAASNFVSGEIFFAV